MPPHSIELKYPERDFRLAWKRLSSGLLSKTARSLYFLIVHERSATRERGFRLLRTRYDSPYCGKGCNELETQTHKYTTCAGLFSVWCFLRDQVEHIEPELVFVTDTNLLNLNFPRLLNESTVIWLLGQYIEFIEDEFLSRGNKVSVSKFKGYVAEAKSNCTNVAMPELGHIPGLTATGIG